MRSTLRNNPITLRVSDWGLGPKTRRCQGRLQSGKSETQIRGFYSVQPEPHGEQGFPAAAVARANSIFKLGLVSRLEYRLRLFPRSMLIGRSTILWYMCEVSLHIDTV